MHRESFRKFAAFSIAAAVWFSAISFYPTAIAGQTTEAKKDAKDTKKPKTSKKDETAKPQADGQTQQPHTLQRVAIDKGLGDEAGDAEAD